MVTVLAPLTVTDWLAANPEDPDHWVYLKWFVEPYDPDTGKKDEKFRDIFEAVGQRDGGQAGEEYFSILPFPEPGVEHAERAAVFGGPDQAAESLPEHNHRGGNLVVEKGLAAALVDVVDPGLDQRIAGRFKRQAVNHHQA